MAPANRPIFSAHGLLAKPTGCARGDAWKPILIAVAAIFLGRILSVYACHSSIYSPSYLTLVATFAGLGWMRGGLSLALALASSRLPLHPKAPRICPRGPEVLYLCVYI